MFFIHDVMLILLFCFCLFFNLKKALGRERKTEVGDYGLGFTQEPFPKYQKGRIVQDKMHDPKGTNICHLFFLKMHNSWKLKI